MNDTHTHTHNVGFCKATDATTYKQYEMLCKYDVTFEAVSASSFMKHTESDVCDELIEIASRGTQIKIKR